MSLRITKKIENDYMKKHRLNCAETILRAANEDFDPGLDKNALFLAAGFGVGSVCGSLCGPIKDKYFKPGAHCKSVVLTASKMLEELLKSDPPE
jgi:hypothetical protein